MKVMKTSDGKWTCFTFGSGTGVFIPVAKFDTKKEAIAYKKNYKED